MLTRAAAAKRRAMQERATPRRIKTPLASENFVDVFSLLPRWQLDTVGISCRKFHHVVSSTMHTVCLRQLDSVRLDKVRVEWNFTANGETFSASFSELGEATEDMTKRITSSAVKCIEFRDVNFTDEMLLKIIKTMVTVHVDMLHATNCNFSSTSERAILDFVSSFLYLRELSLNGCHLMPAQFTNDLLLECARRLDLRRARFDVYVPLDSRALRYDFLDAGVLALLFRETGEGVEISFGRSFDLGTVVSDEFPKRILQYYINTYSAANNVRLTVACDIDQQMSLLADFQQFRRMVARGGDRSAKIVYELPAKGPGKACLAFTKASGFCPRLLRFDSGDFADHCCE